MKPFNILLSLVLLGIALRTLLTPSPEAPADPKHALAELELRVRTDPASALRWCDYAEGLYQAHRIDQARPCFRRALELAPHDPVVWMRAANFHFLLNEPAEALRHSARVLHLVPDFDAVIFHFYDQLIPDQAAILPAIGKEQRAARAYFLHLLRNNQVPSASRAWKWLEGSSHRDARLHGEYVDFLLHSRVYGQAAEVLKAAGSGAADYLRPNHVFNGGFESEPGESRPDWRIRRLESVKVARDSTQPHEGRSALRIAFNGKVNVDFRHVGQLVWTPPGAYRLRYAARAEGITTDQGVSLALRAADPAIGFRLETEPLSGTAPWSVKEQLFTVPPGCGLLELEVVRTRSRKFDSKIAGAVWLDAMSITRVR